jgi:hypothetical protein
MIVPLGRTSHRRVQSVSVFFAKLLQNVMHVKLHRAVSYSQFSRYFLIGQAASYEPCDLMLTSRQAISIHLHSLILLESLRL